MNSDHSNLIMVATMRRVSVGSNESLMSTTIHQITTHAILYHCARCFQGINPGIFPKGVNVVRSGGTFAVASAFRHGLW